MQKVANIAPNVHAQLTPRPDQIGKEPRAFFPLMHHVCSSYTIIDSLDSGMEMGGLGMFGICFQLILYHIALIS